MNGEPPWEIPSDWEWTTLSTVIDTSFYGPRFSKDQYVSSGVPTIRTTDMTASGEIVLRQPPEVKVAAEEMARFELRDGDLLVTRTGSIGRCAVYRSAIGPALPSAYLIRFRINQKLCEPDYLVKYLLAPFGQKSLGAASTATTQPNVNAQAIGAVRLALPPPGQQRKIVERVHSLHARSCSAREALDAVPPLLEKLRQSILAAAFRGDLTKDWRAKHKDVEPASELLKRIRIERRKLWEKAELAKRGTRGRVPRDDRWRSGYEEPQAANSDGLPKLPVGWCWASTDELFSFVTSGSRGWADHYSAQGAMFLRIGNLRDDGIDLDVSDLQRVRPPPGAEGLRTRVRPNDLLISITAVLGRVAIVPDDIEEAYVNQHIALARPMPSVPARFLGLYLASEGAGKTLLMRSNRGVTKAGLGLEDIRSVPVALPPQLEAEAIERRAIEMLRRVRHQAISVKERLAALTSFERAVLAKAFRGELVTQDPNETANLSLCDESTPASAKRAAPRKRREV